MKQDQIVAMLHEWKEAIQQPTSDNLLSPKQLQEMAFGLAESGHRWMKEGLLENEALQECHSTCQFLLDLGEAVVRADHRQTFLSTVLFLFLACATLRKVCGSGDRQFVEVGERLLANYIATAILNERQVGRGF